jgi:hypothetical protein
MINDRWDYMSEKCSFARKSQMTINDQMTAASLQMTKKIIN